MNTIHEIGLQNQQDFWAMLYMYVGRSILDVCGRRGEKAVRRAVREMAREKGKKLASSYREKGVKTNLETLFAGGNHCSDDPRVRLEVLRQDFVKTVRAKGASERVTIFKHVLRNALIPIVTLVGMQIGSLLGGAVIVEQIFSLPGLGQMTLTGINQRDYPVVQGCVLFIAFIYVLVNLITDLLYAYIDPRISYD